MLPLRGAALERLGWRGWGVSLELAAPAHLLEANQHQLPPEGRVDETIERADLHVYWRGGLWECRESGQVSSDLEGLVALEVATLSPVGLFVHAGCVAFGQGVLVLPGPSWAGKSTLVRELTRRGGIYYSDEYAVFTPEGLVRAYPRPLSSRQPGTGLPEARVAVDHQLPRPPLPPRWLLQCRYADFQQLSPLTSGQALLALFANAVAARTRANALFSTLGASLSNVSAYGGMRSDASSCADWILDWVGR